MSGATADHGVHGEGTHPAGRSLIQVPEVEGGSFLWERKCRLPPYTAIEDGTVFASGGLSLGAYDALTGAVRWRQEDTRTLGAIAVVGSSAIGVTRTSLNQVVTGSALRAWSVADGHRQWSVSVGGPDDRFTDPIVANGVVFVGRWTGEGSSGVFAFRRTSGALLSAFRTSGPIRALAVVGDTLLVPDAGTLRAFRVG